MSAQSRVWELEVAIQWPQSLIEKTVSPKRLICLILVDLHIHALDYQIQLWIWKSLKYRAWKRFWNSLGHPWLSNTFPPPPTTPTSPPLQGGSYSKQNIVCCCLDSRTLVYAMISKDLYQSVNPNKEFHIPVCLLIYCFGAKENRTSWDQSPDCGRTLWMATAEVFEVWGRRSLRIGTTALLWAKSFRETGMWPEIIRSFGGFCLLSPSSWDLRNSLSSSTFLLLSTRSSSFWGACFWLHSTSPEQSFSLKLVENRLSPNKMTN